MKPEALESPGAGRDAERDPRVHRPHRQFGRQPSALCEVESDDSMGETPARVAARIRSNRHSFSCGSYVLAVKDGGRVKIFVLKEAGASTLALVDQRSRWLVGLYAADTKDGRRVRCPGTDRLTADLLQHYADIGMKVKP